jgi:[ribosomal protein S18]-alanine N-acetyltransferase
MINNLEVKPMALEHIDGVMVVENLSFKIPWSKKSFIEEITKNKFAIYAIAMIGNKVIGYAGMWKVFDEGHITNIAVHPEFRKNGAACALIEYLLNKAEIEGIASMTLEVRRSNIAAQSLYQKYGFKESGFRKAYYSDNGEDAIIMWR